MSAEALRSRVSSRGQSDIIGLVLLLGLVIAGVTAVVAFGSIAIQDTRQSASVANAEASMTQFDSQAALVAYGSAENQRVELPSTSRSSVSLDETAGSLTITVTDQTTATVVADETITLGTVRYEEGDQTVAYQGGGVWRKSSGGGSRMVSPPEFHYRVDDAGEPTLTLPLVTVAGNGGGGSVQLQKAGPTDTTVLGVSNPLQQGEIDITVESAYYEAWGRFFEQRTSGRVTYDHPNEAVTITLVAPSETGKVKSSIVSDAGTLGLSNNGDVDSYNSSVGPYPSAPDDRASVVVDGDFVPSNNIRVKGEVRAAGDASVSNNIQVDGVTVVGEESDLSNNPTFGDVYSTGGDLDVSGSVDFQDDVLVGGSVTHFDSASVAGSLYADGDVIVNKNADIDGDVVAGGTVEVRKGAQIDGEIHAGEDVVFADKSSYTGDVFAGRNVVLRASKPSVTGDVRAGGQVVLKKKATVDGDVYAGQDTDGDGNAIEVGQNAEVTGAAVAGDDVYVDSKGSVGSVTEGQTPRPSANPDAPRNALDPNVDLPPSAEAAITARANELSNPSENDNDATSAISGNSLQGCGSTCTLPSGRYYLDEIDIGNSDTLEFDTTGGPVTVYVDDDVAVNDGQIEVSGSNTVELYVDDEYDMTGQGEVVVPGDRAPQFWVYMNPGTSASFSNNAVFRGVVYGPGDSSTNGASISVSNNVEIYGALVGDVAGTSNNNEIHYDTALGRVTVLGGEEDVPKVTFIHVSVSEVTVED